ncbi:MULTISPECIES: APH(3')-I family aminoglycoside O-phosphotransferase [unclassified Sphingomonas]|uniref:APH(3')-I family aminoglycoside O-phosphotransferase n=1 Tax=Novosphingobium rhizosphaerae TaxID=1551649 RepID=UPI0015C75829
MTSDREKLCAAPALPAGLAQALEGYAWARDLVGESGGAVYRLHGKPGAPELYLKHGLGSVADAITDEMVRLRWLAGYVPVPPVLHFASTPSEAWLVTAALPGETAFQALQARPAERIAIVDALAAFLRRFHAIPVSECPFNSDHALRLGLARNRINEGLVEADEFDAAREGWSAEQVWQAMQQLLPLAPDPVVTHGDFSLDNLFITGGVVTGCIDTGRAGIADRYQDLAILWNCLGEFAGELQDRLMVAYGEPDIDQGKLQFHLMLDELF